MPISLQSVLFQSVAMALTALFLPRLRITSIFGPILAVLALATINTWFWDSQLFGEIPNAPTVRTGLLLLVNGLIFWVLVKALPGIEVDGFLPALAAPLVFTLTTILITPYLAEVDWAQLFEQLMQAGQELKRMVRDA